MPRASRKDSAGSRGLHPRNLQAKCEHLTRRSRHTPSRGATDNRQSASICSVLVGWSYGGRVMADYLTTHGTAKLAGLNYVDAGQKSDPSFFGPNLRNLPLIVSENLAINIAATPAFLHDCFSIQPTQEEYETMLAFNMMVPPKVRLGLSGRPLDVDDMLRSLKLPVLVTHGAEDKNSNLIAAEYTAKMIPGAKLSIYQGVGHSPFFEAAPRFNAELAAFVRSAQKGN